MAFISNFEALEWFWGRYWEDFKLSEIFEEPDRRSHGSPIFQDLWQRYTEKHRYYHTPQHLVQCLREWALESPSAKSLAQNPVLVELALWYHDIVYDTQRKDNEEQSAELAIKTLGSVLGPKNSEELRQLILATKHTQVPSTPDARLLVDLDLSIMGQRPEVFDQYETQIQQEYSWVPLEIFSQKRGEILQSFLARPQIYQTPHFSQKYEISARNNLAKSLEKLAVKT